jgi:tetratricopeptide (TPR) repeat protein
MTRRGKAAGTGPSKRPTLALCMIVKNEEANLARCLESVKGVVDEIIVVDTGSTDRTVEIARQYGARVFMREWDDDFAAARNVSLSHACSDWILVLDADEALAPEDRTRLMKLLRADGPTAYLLNIHSPVDDRRTSHAVINAFPRLFRRHPDIRFEGRIHEQLSPSIARLGGTVSPSEIRVDHRGYHGRWADLPAKRQRNIGLLKKQLVEHPDDALAHFHLAQVYGLEGKVDEAIAAFRAALSLPGLPPTNRSVALQGLANCLLKRQRFGEAWEECRLALQEDPGYAITHLTGAIALAKLGRHGAALEQVEQYLAKATPQGRRVHGVLDHEPNLAFAWAFEGECYLALREVDRAEACYRRSLSFEPDSPDGHLGMGKIFRIKGRSKEAALAFEKAAVLFKELPHGHLALGEAYAEQGRWVEAAASAEQFLQACPEDAAGLELHAQALLKLNRFREAEEAYRSLVGRAPSGLAYFALACLSDARGDRLAATALCRRAWELDKSDARIPFLLGCCLIDAGQYREALAALLDADRLAPGTPEIEQHLRLLSRKLAGASPGVSPSWATPLDGPSEPDARWASRATGPPLGIQIDDPLPSGEERGMALAGRVAGHGRGPPPFVQPHSSRSFTLTGSGKDVRPSHQAT